MLALHVRVAAARDRTGVAILRDGSRTLTSGAVAASATSGIAARHANADCDPLRAWGHPPFGGYRLLHHAQARSELHAEYGKHLLLFEPAAGQALEAESFGRLALLAYGGPAGPDGGLRRTQGGLRLGNTLLYAIVDRLREDADMVLELQPLSAPAWWQFWKRAEQTIPLSGTAPEPMLPPLDEVSVIEALLMNPALATRRRKPTERDERPGWDDDRDDRHERSGSRDDSGSGRESFQGQGGGSAGGGASGGWDSAPGGGPVVDQAGRIIAGAAAAVGIAAIVNEAASASLPGASETGGGVADAGSAAAGNAGADTGTDFSTTTTTATAY